LPPGQPVRTPQGLYAAILSLGLEDEAKQAVAASTTGLTLDGALYNYFSLIVSNPAASGIELAVPWAEMNPDDPTTSTTPYYWNRIDDLFQAAADWNRNHPDSHPKTIQLAIAAGFSAPAWLFTHMTSCDGLFMDPPQPVSPTCGYTNLFAASESGIDPVNGVDVFNEPYPMPWSSVYKAQWRQFLMALNSHIASNPEWSSIFVWIAVDGVSSVSEEMIIPGRTGMWTLPAPVLPAGVMAASWGGLDAWNQLFENYYGAGSPYTHSNRPFIEEWNASIDMFGEVFSGLTLSISTARNFPYWANPAESGYLSPAPPFAPDCGDGPDTDCPAETAVLAYFAEPSVGGPNGKSTQEDGVIAADRGGGGSLGAASSKWLAWSTQSGLAQLPGSPAVMSRVIAGLQPVSPIIGYIDAEGSYPGHTATTPEQAYDNFLGTIFSGTAAGSFYGPQNISALNGGVSYTSAPFNYLQLYWNDFLYAQGIQFTYTYSNNYIIDPALPTCTVSDLMSGSAAIVSKCTVPASEMAARTVTTAGGAVLTAQQLLNAANAQMIETTGEPAVPWHGFESLECRSGYTWRLAFPGDYVCVTWSEFLQAQVDNLTAPLHFQVNDTVPFGVPYGWCMSGYTWRQAYLGDYVCVTPAQAAQVNADNAAAISRIQP
jgi:hypothetical protein